MQVPQCILCRFWPKVYPPSFWRTVFGKGVLKECNKVQRFLSNRRILSHIPTYQSGCRRCHTFICPLPFFTDFSLELFSVKAHLIWRLRKVRPFVTLQALTLPHHSLYSSQDELFLQKVTNFRTYLPIMHIPFFRSLSIYCPGYIKNKWLLGALLSKEMLPPIIQPFVHSGQSKRLYFVWDVWSYGSFIPF